MVKLAVEEVRQRENVVFSTKSMGMASTYESPSLWSMWWKSGSAYLGTPFAFPPRFAISEVQARVKYWDIMNKMTQQLLLPICFGKKEVIYA